MRLWLLLLGGLSLLRAAPVDRSIVSGGTQSGKVALVADYYYGDDGEPPAPKGPAPIPASAPSPRRGRRHSPRRGRRPSPATAGDADAQSTPTTLAPTPAVPGGTMGGTPPTPVLIPLPTPAGAPGPTPAPSPVTSPDGDDGDDTCEVEEMPQWLFFSDGKARPRPKPCLVSSARTAPPSPPLSPRTTRQRCAPTRLSPQVGPPLNLCASCLFDFFLLRLRPAAPPPSKSTATAPSS